MTNRELARKIAALEKELASYEEQEAHMIKRRRELQQNGATRGALLRSKLELEGVTEHINELRLKLWGLRQLNLPG